jgi:endogenous inhibitor of DNA gyrase (YacG/DUF329 family)
MIRGRCPICGKRFETASIDAWPGFPFCSDRCKLIDLGRWLDGAYQIPVEGDQNSSTVADSREQE